MTTNSTRADGRSSAKALAKRRETMKRRTYGEIKREADALWLHSRRSGRRDVETVGWLAMMASRILGPREVDEKRIDALNAIGHLFTALGALDRVECMAPDVRRSEGNRISQEVMTILETLRPFFAPSPESLTAEMAEVQGVQKDIETRLTKLERARGIERIETNGKVIDMRAWAERQLKDRAVAELDARGVPRWLHGKTEEPEPWVRGKSEQPSEEPES